MSPPVNVRRQSQTDDQKLHVEKKGERHCESLPFLLFCNKTTIPSSMVSCWLRAAGLNPPSHSRQREIYFCASTATSTRTHTGSVAEAIGKSGQTDLFLNVARVGSGLGAGLSASCRALYTVTTDRTCTRTSESGGRGGGEGGRAWGLEMVSQRPFRK